MKEFDFFGEMLFEEAKYYLEIAKSEEEGSEHQVASLHASLLLSMSALEAYVNAVSEELVSSFELNIYEKSLLSEKNIELDKGVPKLGKGLKMQRLIDRIAFIYSKYSMKELSDADLWYMEIKQTIDLRNGLVHPKSVVQVTYTQIEKALWSVLNTVNALYLAVYKRKVPIYNYGIQAKVLGE